MAALNRRDNADLSEGRLGLVGREGAGRVEVLVDHTSHSLLAMAAGGLGTVVPNGVVIFDQNLENIRSFGLALSGGLEAAEERDRDVGVRDAGRCKGGLGNAVVLGQELPLDDIADVCDDILGIEDELTSTTGNDSVCYSGERRAGAGGQVGRGSQNGNGHGQSCDENVSVHFVYAVDA